MLTKNKGGSNLFQYDCSDPDSGIVPKYGTNKAEIDKVLDQMRLSGQDCIQLLLLMHQNPPNGLYIKWDGTQFDPEIKENFLDLISEIEQKGFKFVGIVPEFWGSDDFRQHNLTEEQIYNHYLFMQSIANNLDVFSFDYCIDLCAELDPSPNCIRNAELIWTWWTAINYPNAAPCWNATMSLIPQSDYKFVRDIFKGVDQNGAPNWPARINLHAYRNEAATMLQNLEFVGMPSRNIYWGECFTPMSPSEYGYVDDLHHLVLNERNNYIFERIIQYPIRVNKIGEPEIKILPILFNY